MHRHPGRGGGLIVELELRQTALAGASVGDLAPETIDELLAGAMQRFGAAPSIGALADAVVQTVRELTGYDRVMVYRFDADGHGQVIAEARDPRLTPLLGHHYPASDIPQRARELYLRNHVRMLVDVDAAVQPLQPAGLPPDGEPLDMSLAQLRAMSPLHLQYLRNMGVAASFSASLVHDGRLWGLIAAHHGTPRCLRRPLRTAADLLAEVASTRIAAIENYAHAQVALTVRRLEQRLVEATSSEGDWRYAIFRQPRTLLQPLEATGLVLLHDGELQVAGEAPSTPELQALLDWVRRQPGGEPVACASVAKADPALAHLTPMASGVLAVRLSARGDDWLLWLRKEQLQTVTWAGDPAKPMVGDNPLELSPRRSFAAWSEIVRGTSMPWTTTDLALARAIGRALVDIIGQVQAVRLLIAEQQLVRIRAAVAAASAPLLVLDAQARVVFANEALAVLLPRPAVPGERAAGLFVQPVTVQSALDGLRSATRAWQRQLEVELAGDPPVPVSLRAELVTARDGSTLGTIVLVSDLRSQRAADEASVQLERSLQRVAGGGTREVEDVVAAILTNASLAAMDIADARRGPPVAPLLRGIEASTQRAAELYTQLRTLHR